jgi:hypothetical protein
MIRAQTADLVDTGALGERGVVFETSALGSSTLNDAVGLGDFNGDGLDDLFVSSDAASEVGSSGRTFLSVILGRPALTGRHLLEAPGVSALNLRYADILASRGGFGSLQAAGDVDGDGLADGFIFASEYRTPDLPEGRVWLLNGSPDLRGDHFVEEIGDAIRGTVFYQLVFLDIDDDGKLLVKDATGRLAWEEILPREALLDASPEAGFTEIEHMRAEPPAPREEPGAAPPWEGAAGSEKPARVFSPPQVLAAPRPRPDDPAHPGELDVATASLAELPPVLTAAQWRALEGRLEWSRSRGCFILHEADAGNLFRSPTTRRSRTG